MTDKGQEGIPGIGQALSDTPNATEWVQTECKNPSCRGRKNGGGFMTTVRRGQELTAECNECFCR